MRIITYFVVFFLGIAAGFYSKEYSASTAEELIQEMSNNDVLSSYMSLRSNLGLINAMDGKEASEISSSLKEALPSIANDHLEYLKKRVSDIKDDELKEKVYKLIKKAESYELRSNS